MKQIIKGIYHFIENDITTTFYKKTMKEYLNENIRNGTLDFLFEESFLETLF